jgi:RND family efflux transporter MFP subunit
MRLALCGEDSGSPRRRRWGAPLLLAVALSASGCNSERATPPRPPLRVRTQTVSLEDFSPDIRLTGEIQARVQTDLSFRVSGRIIARDADVGQHVEAGAVLARIDPAEQQADLDAANAAVRAAEATLRQAKAAFDRQRSLIDLGFATRSAYDSAQQALRTAEGSLDQANAQAGSAKDALSYSDLRADKSGVIISRAIEVGQVAQAAQAAFTLAEDGPRDAVFNVYESVFFLNPSGDKIALTLVSDPNVHAVGHVREVAPAVDPKNGTVRVKVEIENPPAAMSLGSAVIGAGAVAPEKVVVLPWSAAASKDGKLAVWTFDPATSAVSLRPVRAEAFEKERLLIRDGLAEGEIVVTEGDKFLFPGEIVAVAEPSR